MTTATAGGLVLAAGEGRRFGTPKALVEVAGERLVDRAVRLLADGGCTPIVVVEGAVGLEVSGHPAGVPIHLVYNPDWQSGMGSSLRAGLDAVREYEVDAVVVALVDQPWLGPEAVRRLRAARVGGAFVAAATYGGARGNPVLLGREVWADVAALAEGDQGARAFMIRHPELVTAVPCDNTGRPDDVDYPEDLDVTKP
ncbi:nucleotidyltransferase family protein [Phytoactinopolyspora halotolerans]|uniref:Nucleotidyltransferase family protein n=1 Tax=Phytoactinopolyspora halotolerans TaxID=1981512 RepID=A0A6L9SAK2_9ACTN|nr:nucleotidyltransferase family protein [Phytoactinopolyspora halotolerans]NEE02139.1 nucleotidyltransferase family protein [Phytoactinopolyspora halotolerans]